MVRRMGRTALGWIAVLTPLVLGACASARDTGPAAGGWRGVASDADRTRIRSWRDAWTAALAKARGSGNRIRIEAQGPLLVPDAAIAGAMPTPGEYRCRVVKLGATTPGMSDFVAEPEATCRVEGGGGTLGLAKLDGAQRPAGWLYADGPTRMIFLGSMRMADERRPLAYGRDPERDIAGILERIGPERWRLVLPRPRWEAMLTVVEIRPAG